MADNKDKSAARGGRRRRPGPTIDLKATEVSTGTPSTDDVTASVDPSPATSTDTTAAAETVQDATRTPSDAGPPPPPESETKPWALPWPAINGAAGGAVVAAIVLLIVWAMGGSSDGPGVTPARIAALETRLAEIAQREPSASPPTQALAPLAERLAKLEAAMRTPPPTVPATDPTLLGRVAKLEGSIGGLGDAIAALKQRADELKASAEAAQREAKTAVETAHAAQAARATNTAGNAEDIAPLRERLASLEATTQSLRGELAAQKSAAQSLQAELAKQQTALRERTAAPPPQDRALRLAVVAFALDAAVLRGEPYRSQLDAAKTLASEPATLAPLDRFAAAGIPSSAAMARNFAPALAAMRRATDVKPAGDTSFLGKLQANAERLVRIRPIGEAEGDDADAILARAEARVARGELAAALEVLRKLPASARAPAEAWIGTAEARNAAIEASHRLAARTIGALAQKPE